ncbi:MAG: peptidoglycan-binding domain-containing protein [Paracoccaceae bacterium]
MGTRTGVLAAALAALLAATPAVANDHEDVRAAQEALAAAGLDPGAADGLMGPQTRAAIAAWQVRAGLEPTGVLDGPTLMRLVDAGATAPGGESLAPEAAAPAPTAGRTAMTPFGLRPPSAEQERPPALEASEPEVEAKPILAAGLPAVGPASLGDRLRAVVLMLAGSLGLFWLADVLFTRRRA